MKEKLKEWAADLQASAVPFVPQGRSRDGLDCWGVVWLAYNEVRGIDLPSYADEYKTEDIRNFPHLEELINKYLPEWEETTNPTEGDVVLMRLRGRPIHVGLVIGDGMMLHIEEGIELCIERYGNAFWRNRIIGFYRYRSL